MFGFIRPADLALASSLVGSSGGSGDASQLYFNARQLQFECVQSPATLPINLPPLKERRARRPGRVCRGARRRACGGAADSPFAETRWWRCWWCRWCRVKLCGDKLPATVVDAAACAVPRAAGALDPGHCRGACALADGAVGLCSCKLPPHVLRLAERLSTRPNTHSTARCC